MTLSTVANPVSASVTLLPASECSTPSSQPMQGFGPHLMLDCRGCNLEKIGDVAYVFDVLNTLPEKIGMTKITQPYVFPYSGLVPEDKGVTGVVIIAESHLSFHSFTEKDYFFFDLFSCKPFEVEAAKRFILEAFDVQHVETHYVERGLDFPRSEALSAVVASENQPIAFNAPATEPRLAATV
jgi:S-adenosylmethionine decarboxylase